MLNYPDIRAQFTEELNKFNKEQLLEWLHFDSKSSFKDEVDIISKLLSGQTVNILSTTLFEEKLSDQKEQFNVTDNTSYAMAA